MGRPAISKYSLYSYLRVGLLTSTSSWSRVTRLGKTPIWLLTSLIYTRFVIPVVRGIGRSWENMPANGNRGFAPHLPQEFPGFGILVGRHGYRFCLNSGHEMVYKRNSDVQGPTTVRSSRWAIEIVRTAELDLLHFIARHFGTRPKRRAEMEIIVLNGIFVVGGLKQSKSGVSKRWSRL